MPELRRARVMRAVLVRFALCVALALSLSATADAQDPGARSEAAPRRVAHTDADALPFVGLVLFVLFAGTAWAAAPPTQAKALRRPPDGSRQNEPSGADPVEWRREVEPARRVDVTVLSIAVAPSAHRLLRARLERIALERLAHGSSGVEHTRALLDALLLRHPSWIAAGVLARVSCEPREAREVLRQTVARLRARVPRFPSIDTLLAKTSDAGVLVVSLVVAARRERLDLRDAHEPAQLRRALQGLRRLDLESLGGLTCVCAPDANGEALAEGDVARFFPELYPLPPLPVVCTHRTALRGNFREPAFTRCPLCEAATDAAGSSNAPG